jgi:hypothetical protein
VVKSSILLQDAAFFMQKSIDSAPVAATMLQEFL